MMGIFVLFIFLYNFSKLFRFYFINFTTNITHLIEQLISLDKSLFLYLNGMHNDFFDFVMYWISDKYIWIPFYIFLIYLVIKKYKLRTIDVMVAVAVLITISDMTSVYCFKEVFHRLRPCQNDEIKPFVHLVNGYCGGMYGFISSHAANTFALCFFLIKIFGGEIKYLTFGMIIWACVVSYTRIYLGVHYPFDVFCGALFGIIVGILIGKLFNWYYRKYVLKSINIPHSANAV